jgi:cob(I)alamin adenosyltransferase
MLPRVKIYTRGGDRGETGLMGGARVRKSSLRVAAYGEVDELNATLGVAAAALAHDTPAAAGKSPREALTEIQRTLFDLGAELAAPPGTKAAKTAPPVTETQVTTLEQAIDALSERLPPLRNFILPGGSPGASSLHLARGVCRRAERAVVALADVEPVRDEVLAYLNRLSDYLFVLARAVNADAGVTEPVWRGGD